MKKTLNTKCKRCGRLLAENHYGNKLCEICKMDRPSTIIATLGIIIVIIWAIGTIMLVREYNINHPITKTSCIYEISDLDIETKYVSNGKAVVPINNSQEKVQVSAEYYYSFKNRR